ncbi:hypothetical protein ACJX0J_017063, partial [Zea mays]
LTKDTRLTPFLLWLLLLHRNTTSHHSTVCDNDFAVTENHAIIPDQQIVFKLQEMVLGGSPVVYDRNKTARFGVLPKRATDASRLRWVDVPDCFCFHLWNAWEDEATGEIVVIGSCMTPADAVFNESAAGEESFRSVLSEIRLDPRTGTSSRRAVLSDADQVNLEAGMVNRQLLGRRTRYAYLAIAEPWPKVSGFAKVDLEAGTVEKFIYGDGRYGGEPCFVPHLDAPAGAAEDDGYVLCYVHDEGRGASEMLVVNARDMRAEAAVKLSGRVPYGLHGTFIASKNICDQQEFGDGAKVEHAGQIPVCEANAGGLKVSLNGLEELVQTSDWTQVDLNLDQSLSQVGDIRPWKYLVPCMREDLFARITGLTNNSYFDGAHEVRHYLRKHSDLGCIVLEVAKVYVSTVQANNYPITCTQWHPEKAIFEWRKPMIPHNEDAIQVTQHFANHFISQARKSPNRPPADKVLDNLIYNYSPTFTGKKS